VIRGDVAGRPSPFRAVICRAGDAADAPSLAGDLKRASLFWMISVGPLTKEDAGR
jgi:hypothetical protein